LGIARLHGAIGVAVVDQDIYISLAFVSFCASWIITHGFPVVAPSFLDLGSFTTGLCSTSFS
jgi:hypothetical protein